MGQVKQQLLESLTDERAMPSHLEKEMYQEIVKLKKQVNAIKIILEECK
tara:strand:- start:322 stop:468 length:147 start_codon:yes stop_codon:yes gene_type:complete